MSVRQGNNLIAGSGRGTPCLFDFKWADHILNNVSWLRADTFSWQSGAVYQAAYQHLVDDIDGKTLQSETIGDTTIQFYLADDGHKICPASEENNVMAIYNATGVAWYYILDAVNQRFKLPRTQFGVTGLRDTVGKYVPETLPNITGTIAKWNSYLTGGVSGAIKDIGRSSGTRFLQHSGDTPEQTIVGFDASGSSSVYQNGAPVQQKATQMYLYFYVGSFTQTAIENTAGVTTEELNTKVDTTSSWGAPSSNYDDLTLGASGTTYTAPADGWFVLGKVATGDQYIMLVDNDTNFGVQIRGHNGSNARTFIPCRKGQVISVGYTFGGNTTVFRFVYAQKTN